MLVKRRNEVAHGYETYIARDEVDDLVSKVVGLMRLFRNALENKVYQRSYLAASSPGEDL
jgi:MAE_28990/MAE_18760-like HEPN